MAADDRVDAPEGGGPLAPGEARRPGPSTDAPGMSPGLGFVYDQDTGNLAMQSKSFQASTERGEILGDDREARIRHFHQALGAVLAWVP